jgi:hypothetical protein
MLYSSSSPNDYVMVYLVMCDQFCWQEFKCSIAGWATHYA